MKFLRPLAAALVAADLVARGVRRRRQRQRPADRGDTTIITLSNRADLISGGSALVEVKMPGFVLPASLKIDRDGTDITAAFATERRAAGSSAWSPG